MRLEPGQFERVLLDETGIAFGVETGVDGESRRWYLLRLRDLADRHGFAIRIIIDWRRLIIAFEPGDFASELLADMSRADETGRAAFRAILADCSNDGAKINLLVNDQAYGVDNEKIWSQGWNRFRLSLDKGHLELDTEDGEPDAAIIRRWTGKFMAAIIAILPTEQRFEDSNSGICGYPEGAVTTVKTNRYERDRRNRNMAISIHGTSCAACGLDMGRHYGQVAVGYIEIHHTTPVSQLGPGYVIDPVRDLIPLCPNCHAVAHRRDPPYSAEEIQSFLAGEEH